MSDAINRIRFWRINQTETLLARLSSADGTGAATGQEGQGNFIQAAQVSTITAKVYDLNSTTYTTPVATPTITSAAVIAATSDTSRWTLGGSFNFQYSLLMSDAGITTAGRTYRLVIRVTLTTGTVCEVAYEAEAVNATPT